MIPSEEVQAELGDVEIGPGSDYSYYFPSPLPDSRENIVR